jgi:hypothetical protein
MTEHLSAQGRQDPRGASIICSVENKTWTPPIDISNTLKIIKNGIKLRKLWPPKVKGVKNSKNTNH